MSRRFQSGFGFKKLVVVRNTERPGDARLLQLVASADCAQQQGPPLPAPGLHGKHGKKRRNAQQEQKGKNKKQNPREKRTIRKDYEPRYSAPKSSVGMRRVQLPSTRNKLPPEVIVGRPARIVQVSELCEQGKEILLGTETQPPPKIEVRSDAKRPKAEWYSGSTGRRYIGT